MKTFHVEDFKTWPATISDGLELKCECCKNPTNFDYHVDDKFWKDVVPTNNVRDVICLSCLDFLATKMGRSVCNHLQEVQFTGIDMTILLMPTVTFTGTRQD